MGRGPLGRPVCAGSGRRRPGSRPTAGIQEHLRAVAANRGTAAHERGSGGGASTACRPTGTTRSLPPLPTTRTSGRRDRRGPVEPDRFRDAQAGPVEQFDECLIAERRVVRFRVAASISRSASPGESVFGSGFGRRGSATAAAGSSPRTPASGGGGRSCGPTRCGARSSTARARLRGVGRLYRSAPPWLPCDRLVEEAWRAASGRGGTRRPCAASDGRRAG